jgi:NitT/TauT family transport system permease protein
VLGGYTTRIRLYQIGVLVGLVLLLEVLCLTGVIDKITMQAPHLIARDLYRMLVSGRMNGAIAKTLGNTLLALALALCVGVATGALLHRFRTLRDTLDPLFATYYAVPVFAFYPFFIVVFGLGDTPQVLIAFMLGVVAVIVNTLNGLDRVPTVLAKTARILRMSPTDTALRMTLPYAGPYILTGVKLAVAYAFIGVIGSEFIMSRGGIGYEISFAYANFDNAVMYPLILLILLASIAVNGLLTVWEQRLLARRGMR